MTLILFYARANFYILNIHRLYFMSAQLRVFDHCSEYIINIFVLEENEYFITKMWHAFAFFLLLLREIHHFDALARITNDFSSC